MERQDAHTNSNLLLAVQQDSGSKVLMTQHIISICEHYMHNNTLFCEVY